MYRLHGNLGASASWNLQCLFRLIMGLLSFICWIVSSKKIARFILIAAVSQENPIKLTKYKDITLWPLFITYSCCHLILSFISCLYTCFIIYKFQESFHRYKRVPKVKNLLTFIRRLQAQRITRRWYAKEEVYGLFLTLDFHIFILAWWLSLLIFEFYFFQPSFLGIDKQQVYQITMLSTRVYTCLNPLTLIPYQADRYSRHVASQSRRCVHPKATFPNFCSH
jgi:hypothetical protein